MYLLSTVRVGVSEKVKKSPCFHVISKSLTTRKAYQRSVNIFTLLFLAIKVNLAMPLKKLYF